MLNGWPTDSPPDSDAAYLVGIVKNASKEFLKKKTAQKCDDRLVSPLIDEGASGPIDVNLVDDCDVPSSSSGCAPRSAFAPSPSS